MFQDLFVDSADNGQVLAFKLRIARDKNSSSAFSCSYASSVLNKIRNSLTVCGTHLRLQIPLTFCGIHLQLRNLEQIANFACCRIRDTTNLRTKITLHSYVRGIHGSLKVKSTYFLEHVSRLVFGNHEHTDTKLSGYQCTVWPRNENKLFLCPVSSGT